MLKRLALLIVLLLPTLALAQDDLNGAAAMARYFPANTVVFGAVRTDDDFLSLLETLAQPALQMAQASGQPAMTLREALNTELASVNTDVDAIMAWLGDHAAIGVTPEALAPTSATPRGVYAAIEIADRAGAKAFLRKTLPSRYTSADQGDYTVFTADSSSDPNLAISNDLLLIYPAGTALPLLTREARLDSSAAYRSAVAALPADQYNVLIYADPSVIAPQVPLDPTGQFTLDLAPLAAGFTVLDGRTFTLDFAQLPVVGAPVSLPASVDPDFARFIPGDASGVIHATNLTALYNSTMQFVDTMSGGASSPLPSAQAEQVFSTLGIDLQDDLLSWTTGDYALFYRTDLLGLLPSLLSGSPPDLSGLGSRFDFGLVIEATDPAKAQALATQLGTLLRMAAGQEGITVSRATIGGVNVTVLSLSAPIDSQSTLDLDFVVGATRNVFFFATRPAAETIISGDGMLVNNPGYVEAQQYLLPNPTAIWYADGEGLIMGTGMATLVPLALLGPAIGNIFDNIVAELESEGGVVVTPTATPTPAPLIPAADTAAVLAQIEQGVRSISSSSISATVTDDGVHLLRFVVTRAQS